MFICRAEKKTRENLTLDPRVKIDSALLPKFPISRTSAAAYALVSVFIIIFSIILVAGSGAGRSVFAPWGGITWSGTSSSSGTCIINWCETIPYLRFGNITIYLSAREARLKFLVILTGRIAVFVSLGRKGRKRIHACWQYQDEESHYRFMKSPNFWFHCA